jgi:hypothetical protein
MDPSDATGLHPAVLKVCLLAAGICALVVITIVAYGASLLDASLE